MITKTENQRVRLKKKIKNFYFFTEPYIKNGFCPTKQLLSTSLDKWSLFCIFNLGYHDVLRFNELKKSIDGISSRMLTVTLKKLEKHAIVERKVYSEIPPKVEYTLTEFGFQLSDKLIDLSSWFITNSKFFK